jgi:hypothetical protein
MAVLVGRKRCGRHVCLARAAVIRIALQSVLEFIPVGPWDSCNMEIKFGFNFGLLVDENLELVHENIFGLMLTTFLFYSAVVLVARTMFPVKKLAWAISLINSFIMSVIGVFFLLDILPRIRMEWFTCLGGTTSAMHGIDNFGVFTCVIFAVANVTDLILGLVFYPSELGLLTTYIHHTLYTWLMFFGVTKNGLFVQTSGPFSTAFLFCTIEEIPTFLLALGSMFPSCRTDLGFGATFFVTRLLFHVTILHHEVRCNGYAPMYALISLTLLLHVHWFYGWISKYLFPKNKKQDSLSSKNK